MEGCIAVGLLAVEMGIDEVSDGQIRILRDGGFDLVVERRELGIHHDDAVVADHDEDVAANAFEACKSCCQGRWF